MRRLWRLLSGVGIGVLVLFGTLASAGSGAPPSCDLTQLQLRDSTVNQGLGSYDRLVRGKETLVRMYFSLPSCADTRSSIQITGGTVSATGAGGTLASGIAGTPTPVTTYPSAATYGAAPVNDIPADIKFVVPGSALAPGGTTDAYTASFSATINFQYKTSSNATPVAASKAFTTFASKTIEKKTNALRILVVPMGNASNSYSTEFPADAVAAVQNGMQTLSRIYPVPDGVTTLGTDSGGIRYAIDSTLLDVSTPFCGTGVNFDAIKAQLAQFLLSWNTANPTAQADKVVGAVWSGNSLGSANGCAEGMASVISPEAWVRAFPDSVSSPSMTGALFAMEIAHTFGLTPPARSFSTFHSLNTAADGTAPNRGYNVTTRSFLADDRTAMNFTGTWNNNTTILEKEDYAYLVCALGGQTNTECTTSNVAGTVGGVAAFSGAFTASGTTDGTNAGTAVQESFAASDLVGLGVDSNSDYKLVQRSASNAILQTNGIRVAFNESHHDASPGTDGSPKGTFGFVVSRNISAEKFELWKGVVGTGTLLWSTQKTNPPTINSFTATIGGVRNFTRTSFLSETEPSLTSDGKWVAYNVGTGLDVAPGDRPNDRFSIPFPAVNGTNGPILYTSGSTIHSVNADGRLDTVVFDATGTGVIGPADPEWSPDLTKVVFSATSNGNTDIYTVNRNGSGLRRLTTDPAVDSKPAWGRKGQIVFVRGPVGGGPSNELYSIRADGTAETRLTNDGVTDDEPTISPDGNQIAWQTVRAQGRGWDIYKMPINGSGDMTLLSGDVTGNNLRPDWSPDGSTVAFANFHFPFGQNDVDVYTVNANGTGAFDVTPTDQREDSPKWSGDGTTLLISTGNGMATVPAAGGTQTPLSNVPGGDDWGLVPPFMSGPAWGTSVGDKAKLAYALDGDIFTVDVNVGGSSPVFGNPILRYDHITSEGQKALHPTWSPDETKIAFAEDQTNLSDIVVLNLATGARSFLTTNEGARNPSWTRGTDVGPTSIAYEKPNATTGGVDIWTVAEGGSPQQFLQNAAQPASAPDGSLAFQRNGEIWRFVPGNPSVTEKVFDNGADPAVGGGTYAFVRGIGGGEFPPTDIMLGSPGSGVTINAQVTDDNAGDDRLDLLVVCPGRTYIGAVAVNPTDASGTSASWQANYDPSLTCANPTLKLAVNDGFNRVVTGTGQDVQAEQKSPTAAIYAPSPGQTFLQYQLIPARVSGWDPEDGTLPNDKLSLKLEGPGGFVATGTGRHVDFSAPAGGFPLGSYTLTLTVTDSAGNTDTATRSLTVIGDADNDGMSTDEEGQSCITFNTLDYPSADQDPMNAFRDDDNDGLVNVADSKPCVAASEYEASIVFDPSSMQLGSQGTVTANITVPNRQATEIQDAYVKSINGIDVSDNAQLRAKQLIVVRGQNIAQAKFDRTPLSAFFVAHNITAGQTVRIVIAGTGGDGSWTFEGAGSLGVS